MHGMFREATNQKRLNRGRSGWGGDAFCRGVSKESIRVFSVEGTSFPNRLWRIFNAAHHTAGGHFLHARWSAALAWYSGLSSEEQREADRIACEYAEVIFGKTLKELSGEQAKYVASLTKRHFVR